MNEDRLTETVATRMTRRMRKKLQEKARALDLRECDVVRWAVARMLAGDPNVAFNPLAEVVGSVRDREAESGTRD
jgi:hypothetical protein